MRHRFGYNEYVWRQRSTREPVDLDTDQLVNGHVMLLGMSGSGKSHTLRQLCTSAVQQGLELDIFDVHEELDVPGAKAVKFSEATGYGFNPLVLNPDPHSGGIRKRINALIRLLNSSGWTMGPKQESALRNLLSDIYWLHGCYADNPSSWVKQEITEAHRSELLRAHRYGEFKHFYPTMEDLLSFANRKIKQLYLGADTKAVSALERVNRLANRINRILRDHQRQGKSDEDLEKLEAQLDKAKGEASAAYADYVGNIESGREVAEVLRYGSRDVLQGVVDRVNVLNGSGVLRANPPPFGEARVRVYQLKALSPEEQRLLVQLRIQEIFRRRRDAGIDEGVRHALVVDEAHLFFDDTPDNALNVAAKEGRKWGLGLWSASQQPAHFSTDFVSSVGTTVLLGLHSTHWEAACRKLRIEPKELRYIRPREVAAIKIQRAGETDARFRNVITSPAGMQPAPSRQKSAPVADAGLPRFN